MVNAASPLPVVTDHASSSNDGLIVLDAGLPVGFVILAAIASAEGLIELRRIAVSRRGAGIGRAAFDQALAFAFTRCSAARVWLDVLPANVRARRVYQAAGFIADDHPLDEGHPSPDRLPHLLVMSIRPVDWELFRSQTLNTFSANS